MITNTQRPVSDVVSLFPTISLIEQMAVRSALHAPLDSVCTPSNSAILVLDRLLAELQSSIASSSS